MLGTGAYRAELDAECRRVLRFAAASRHPDGGFAWLDDRGRPQLDRPVEGYVTARMTHVFAIGTLLGLAGQDELVAHGIAALRDLLHDREYGGWYAAVRPTDSGKKAYEHAFVLLAASSAAVVGAGDTLLADALDVQQRHFWREDDGMVVEEWDRPRRTLDRYRGANANMHTVEAYLAAADAAPTRSGASGRCGSPSGSCTGWRGSPAGCCPSTTTRAGRRCRSSTGIGRPTSSARTG